MTEKPIIYISGLLLGIFISVMFTEVVFNQFLHIYISPISVSVVITGIFAIGMLCMYLSKMKISIPKILLDFCLGLLVIVLFPVLLIFAVIDYFVNLIRSFPPKSPPCRPQYISKQYYLPMQRSRHHSNYTGPKVIDIPPPLPKQNPHVLGLVNRLKKAMDQRQSIKILDHNDETHIISPYVLGLKFHHHWIFGMHPSSSNFLKYRLEDIQEITIIAKPFVKIGEYRPNKPILDEILYSISY